MRILIKNSRNQTMYNDTVERFVSEMYDDQESGVLETHDQRIDELAKRFGRLIGILVTEGVIDGRQTAYIRQGPAYQINPPKTTIELIKENG